MIAEKLRGFKKCGSCQIVKTYQNFSLNKSNKDNYQDYCKECSTAEETKIRKRYNGLYGVWKGMKARCSDPKSPHYKYYGSKGIRVCPEWRNNFQVFYSWAKYKHRIGLEIDRIDNDKGYYPENCRFVTRLVNARNRSVNKLNEEKVEQIKVLLKENKLSKAKIGKMFKVTDTSICRIDKGTLWK